MDSNFQKFLKWFKKPNMRDFIIIGLYFPVFTVIGILFSKGVLEYPEGMFSYLKDLANTATKTSIYGFYSFTFIILLTFNFYTTFIFFYSESGAVQLIKNNFNNDSMGFPKEEEYIFEKSIVSFFSIFTGFIVNITLFQFYLPIYGTILFGSLILYAIANK